MMATARISVVCPICQTSVKDDMQLGSDDTLWGTIPLTDQGCIEVTHTSRAINEHMATHTPDERSAAFERHYRQQHAAATSILDRLFGGVDKAE